MSTRTLSAPLVWPALQTKRSIATASLLLSALSAVVALEHEALFNFSCQLPNYGFGCVGAAILCGRFWLSMIHGLHKHNKTHAATFSPKHPEPSSFVLRTRGVKVWYRGVALTVLVPLAAMALQCATEGGCRVLQLCSKILCLKASRIA